MVGPQTFWANYYNITLYKDYGSGGVKISSVHYKRRILVNGFGEARSEARIAQVVGVIDVLGRGQPATPARESGEAL